MTRRSPRRSAFTLVELLVAMLLATILMGVISFVFMQSNRIYSETLDEIDATNVVRSCMEILADDLRGIQLPPPSGGTPHLGIGSADNGGPNGDQAADVLEYWTLDRWGTGAPARIIISIDATTGFLVRQDLTAGVDVNLAPNVEAFKVSYAWSTWPNGPTNGSTLAWLRGDPLSSSASPPSTIDGSKFVWRGLGTVNTDSELQATAWDPATLIPLEAATTAYILQANGGGGYPVVALTGAFNSVVLAGAPPVTGAPFVVPLLPGKLRITIKHRTPLGHQRSLERVLNVTR